MARAYFIGQFDIHDPQAYAAYRALYPALQPIVSRPPVSRAELQ